MPDAATITMWVGTLFSDVVDPPYLVDVVGVNDVTDDPFLLQGIVGGEAVTVANIQDAGNTAGLDFGL